MDQAPNDTVSPAKQNRRGKVNHSLNIINNNS